MSSSTLNAWQILLASDTARLQSSAIGPGRRGAVLLLYKIDSITYVAADSVYIFNLIERGSIHHVKYKSVSTCCTDVIQLACVCVKLNEGEKFRRLVYVLLRVG